MAPPGYTNDEWDALRLDCVRQLALRGAYRPAALPLGVVQSWFAHADHEMVPRLLGELAEDADCPLEFVGTSKDAIWLTSPEATERFLELD